MIVGGVQWTTLLDYPDRVAVTLFAAGCNFRCPFCHNPELVLPKRVTEVGKALDDSFFAELSARKGFLDAVVVSGGEPTLQSDLPDVLGQMKRMGFLIKLDTNGTRPDVLERLLAAKLADFVAMDIKAPESVYGELAGCVVDVTSIRRSIRVIRQCAPDYEFRTTAAPGLSAADLLAIGQWLGNGRAYWLQRFQVSASKALVDETCRDAQALSETELTRVWRKLEHRFERGGVRG